MIGTWLTPASYGSSSGCPNTITVASRTGRHAVVRHCSQAGRNFQTVHVN